MDLSDLRIFRTVVEEGGITRAAQRLHRVQSNVTTRVRQLEEKLGVELFIREGKRLHLAPAGQLLLSYADKLLDLAKEAEEAVQASRPRGPFRLGTMESTAITRLPVPLGEYSRRHPEVDLELRTGNPGQLRAALLNGELDAAFVPDPVPTAQFETVAAFEEPLIIVAPAGQPSLSSDRPPTTAIVFEQGCPHRERLEAWYASQGASPEKVIELSSYHVILGCVILGMGIALVPARVLETFPGREKLSLHALPPNSDRLMTRFIWRRGARSPKVAALAELVAPAAHAENRDS